MKDLIPFLTDAIFYLNDLEIISREIEKVQSFIKYLYDIGYFFDSVKFKNIHPKKNSIKTDKESFKIFKRLQKPTEIGYVFSSSAQEEFDDVF